MILEYCKKEGEKKQAPSPSQTQQVIMEENLCCVGGGSQGWIEPESFHLLGVGRVKEGQRPGVNPDPFLFLVSSCYSIPHHLTVAIFSISDLI